MITEKVLEQIIMKMLKKDEALIQKIITEYLKTDEFKELVIDRAQCEVENTLECSDEFENGVIKLALANISKQLINK